MTRRAGVDDSGQLAARKAVRRRKVLSGPLRHNRAKPEKSHGDFVNNHSVRGKSVAGARCGQVRQPDVFIAIHHAALARNKLLTGAFRDLRLGPPETCQRLGQTQLSVAVPIAGVHTDQGIVNVLGQRQVAHHPHCAEHFRGVFGDAVHGP